MARFTHKHLCSTFANFQTPPNPNMYRAIVLPAESEAPYFAWYEATVSLYASETAPLIDPTAVDPLSGVLMYDAGGAMHNSHVEELLGDDNPSPEFVRHVVLGKIGNGEHLDHGIDLVFRDEFMYDGSITNKSFMHLTKLRTSPKYRGPIVFFGRNKVSVAERCCHLDCSDLTIALEGIIRHHIQSDLGALYSSRIQVPPKVQGVTVGATAPFYRKVKIPIQHPIFDGPQSEYCKGLGLPILTYRQASMVQQRQNSAL
jgi:hypothetical protein